MSHSIVDMNYLGRFSVSDIVYKGGDTHQCIVTVDDTDKVNIFSYSETCKLIKLIANF